MDPSWLFLIVIAMFHLVPSLMIVMGVFSLIWPRQAWSLDVARGIKGIEPTAAALIMTRVGGLFGCLFGAAFLFAVTHLFPFSVQPGAQVPAQAAPAPPK